MPHYILSEAIELLRYRLVNAARNKAALLNVVEANEVLARVADDIGGGHICETNPADETAEWQGDQRRFVGVTPLGKALVEETERLVPLERYSRAR